MTSPSFHFEDKSNATVACQEYYGNWDRLYCDAFYVFDPKAKRHRDIRSDAPQIGHLSYGVFEWNQFCIEIADSSNVAEGKATYIGQCMSTDPDVQIVRLLETDELTMVTGFFVFSWVIGYTSGQIVRAITKAVEAV